MGICNSCDSTHVATAKLILQDGRLQEFSYPVKVSNVLAKNPSLFICNADEMEFDDVLSAINGEELLQPGQLYFALPLSRLKHPLLPEEMAALAVKASSALSTDKWGCRRKMDFSGDVKVAKKVDSAVSGGGGNNDGRTRRGGAGGCGGRKFTANLSAIPE